MAKGKHGGARAGGGRPRGLSKATVLKQTKRAEVIAAVIDSGKPLAVTVLQKAMEFAEGAVAAYRPTMAIEAAKAAAAGQPHPSNPDGSHEEFGRWFDRWFRCIETMAKYQTPQMKAIDAPTAAPDAKGQPVLEFSVDVFADGRKVA